MKNLSEKIWCLKVPDVHVFIEKIWCHNLPLNVSTLLELLTCNFSLQYPYNTHQTGNENTQTHQLTL